MGVLVTRPAHQARAVIGAIENEGGRAIPFPVMDIRARADADVRKDEADLPTADVAIFISSNAVEHGLAFVEESIRIAAVGPATKKALESAGRRVDIVSDDGYDSEHLLQTEALQDVADSTIRILRGEGGRELLADTLRERGARVDYLEVYRREAHRFSSEELKALSASWAAGDVDAVIAMSVESLEFLLAALPEDCRSALRGVSLVTPSERVIQTAMNAAPEMDALLAAGPGTDDILQALIAIRQQRQEKPMSETGEKPVEENVSDAGDAEFPAEEATEAEISIAPPRRFSPVAWLALLISLAALAGVAWLWLFTPKETETDSANQASVQALNRSIEATEESISAIQDRLSSLIEAESSRSAEVATLERELEMQLQAMESIPGRLSNLEGSISSLQGISSGVRDTWFLAEAEYYMQIERAVAACRQPASSCAGVATGRRKSPAAREPGVDQCQARHRGRVTRA